MFDECSKCGISGKERKLFEVISGGGIVKVCKECASEEDIPFLKQPSVKEREEEKMKDIVSNLSVPKNPRRSVVYERLVRISGIDRNQYEQDLEMKDKREFMKKQDGELKKVVEKNVNVDHVPQDVSNFVSNFHWIIMRARRMRHLTVEDLAEKILEPVGVINALEKGIVPENFIKVMRKIEDFLGIRIINQEQNSSFEEQVDEVKKDFEEEVSFDPTTTKMLTISDLKDMKDKKEIEIFEKSDEFFREDFEEEEKDETS